MAASIIPKSLLPTAAAASSTRRALLTPLLRQSLRPATKTTTIRPLLPLSSRRSLHQTFQRQNQTPSKPATTSSLPDFSLANRVIIVSGGARGLGLTQAQALLEAGAASVHALDRLPHPPADSDFARVAASSAALAAGPPRLHYHRVDVRDQSALAKIVGGIAEKEGRIDGLIAAAGIQQETPALEYSAEDVDKMMGVNVTGVFMTAQAVAREMIKRKQKGSMVLVGSMSGTVANRGLICPAYNASKAAVLQLARNLASEWGEHGIRVNTLSPGYIVTAMTDSLFEAVPERRTAWPDANMLKRLSYPEEYRGAAVFLLSDASSFMTGADLRIDGGHCAW